MSHLHEKVSALLDGELRGHTRQRALAHARQCLACRRELEATFALKQRLGGLRTDDQPSADLFSTLGGVAGKVGEPTGRRSRIAVAGRRLLVGAGSVSVVMLSLAYVVGGPDDGVTTLIAPPIEEFSAEFAGRTGVEALSEPAVGALLGEVDLAPFEVDTDDGTTGGNHDETGSGGKGYSKDFTSGDGPLEDHSPPGMTTAAWRAVVAVPLFSTVDDPRAVEELTRAVAAPSLIAYVGTKVMDSFDGRDTEGVRLRIRHAPGQGTSFGIQANDDESFSTFLADDQYAATNAMNAQAVRLLVEGYDLSAAGSDEVVGRAATVLAITQDGQLRARFWIDEDTGLLLKREIYLDGQIVRSSEFVALRVVPHEFLTHLPPELAEPFAVVSLADARALTSAGWSCPASLGGFSLTRVDEMASGSDIHAVYSDGLSNVSVFEARGALDASELGGFEVKDVGRAAVYVRYGLPTTVVWESTGRVYTVVTDAPRETALALVEALPHSGPVEVSVTSRVGAGLEKIAAALSPIR